MVELTSKFISQSDGTQISIDDYVNKKMKGKSFENMYYEPSGKKTRKADYGNIELSRSPGIESPDSGRPTSTKESLLKELYATRIEIADFADTTEVGPKGTSTVLKTEMGMNIVIPKGKIKALHYFVKLYDPDNPSVKIVALDGLPSDKLDIIKGPDVTVKIALSKTFQFIVGDIIPNPIDVSLGPWTFPLWKVKKVTADFSDPGIDPEWFFQGDGIQHELKVALSIEKPAGVKKIDAKVRAVWDLQTSVVDMIFPKLSDEEKIIHIWK